MGETSPLGNLTADPRVLLTATHIKKHSGHHGLNVVGLESQIACSGLLAG